MERDADEVHAPAETSPESDAPAAPSTSSTINDSHQQTPPPQSPAGHEKSSDEDTEDQGDGDNETATASLHDDDSTLGEADYHSETATLSSDILRYREENGRTYHSYGSTEHWGPNDEQAMEQQDLSHHLWTLVLEDKFFLAPVTNPQKVLDLGTGTGIWAMDVADRYPSAEVRGIDLSPIQPLWTPPNCRFEVDDYNIPDWGVESRYDLIHSRELLGSIPNWLSFLSKAFQALKPGGWIDCAEPDIHVTSDHVQLPDDDPNQQWVKLFREVSVRSGMTFEPATQLKGWLEDVGFVNVTEKIYRVPVGIWPQDPKQRTLGLWNQARLSKGMRDFTERRMRNFMGWNDDEIDVLIARSRAAVHNSNLCTQQNL
ncbi:related to TAM domain methyltransferase [Phialocephala subalpina]|uniref:Related to TAM domain methyltransferase n=1 Tax=Phialocephala subalpina TaxID=576137 RepID=A0A1L7XMT2_9HELO|nr:related to TAM domain methyltransferase [Phialocephala subalpina]